MKKVTITLNGVVTYSAHRTVEILLPDDENEFLLHPDTLNDLADKGRIMWLFEKYGHFDTTDYAIDGVDAIEDCEPTVIIEAVAATTGHINR